MVSGVGHVHEVLHRGVDRGLRPVVVEVPEAGRAVLVGRVVDATAGPVEGAFPPGGETLYVTLNGEDAVVAVSIATQAVVGKAAVGDGPVQVYVTPDESLVLVANQGSEDLPGTTLSFVDAVKLAELDTV